MSTDWAQWSRDAVQLMNTRNAAWQQRFDLPVGCPYDWTLQPPELRFRRGDDDIVAARLVLVGTVSAQAGTFLWSWANPANATEAIAGIESVREFGQRHDLGLLTTPELPGGRPQGLEMLAVAARVLDAEGCWIDSSGDLLMLFALSGFHRRSSDMPGNTSAAAPSLLAKWRRWIRAC